MAIFSFKIHSLEISKWSRNVDQIFQRFSKPRPRERALKWLRNLEVNFEVLWWVGWGVARYFPLLHKVFLFHNFYYFIISIKPLCLLKVLVFCLSFLVHASKKLINFIDRSIDWWFSKPTSIKRMLITREAAGRNIDKVRPAKLGILTKYLIAHLQNWSSVRCIIACESWYASNILMAHLVFMAGLCGASC